MPGRVLILAGGGGHTAHAHTLAQELEGKTELSFLVPEGDQLSKMRLEPFGRVETLLKPRHPRTPLHSFIPRLLLSFLQSLTKVPEGCRVVVSTGSNFCVPPALLSRFKGMPLINLESVTRFLRPSTTARILQPFSDLTVLQWEEQRKFLKGEVFGPFLPRRRLAPWNGRYILIVGGTYGFEELLDIASRSRLKNVVLQTGKVDPREYIKRHPDWKVITTTEGFYKLIAGAQIVVTPPGATPLEAITYGKPIVIVRYPKWSRAGAPEEARLLASKLNAPFVSELSPQTLIEAIEEAKDRKTPQLTDGAKALAEYITKEYLKPSFPHQRRV
jgi:UDP-N-acetylglucosamine--N-acetylmuramyl-(pentapeptide) pyrophosphoryl-undecaprenol N-acetylglucosamine transferase